MLDLFKDMQLPSNEDFVDGIVNEYQKELKSIAFIAHVFSDKRFKKAIEYFHKYRDKLKAGADGEKMDYAKPEGAVRVLNAELWQKALLHTDVFDFMPAARREEWNDQITKLNTLEISQESVRTTLGELMHARSRFFSEKIDGVFRALSNTHVTNQPQGFSKRMIINGVINNYGTTEWRKVAYIHDLRCVIAKFMGRSEPEHNSTAEMINWVRRENGQWQSVDSGSLRMRVYNGVGTVHVEVHPDMAWRLNAMLANIYPNAIPDAARRKPAKKTTVKDFVLMDNPLSFEVLQLIGTVEQETTLSGSRYNYIRTPVENSYRIKQSQDKHVNQAAADVLEHIGGISKGGGKWFFDYDPVGVCKRINYEGSMPDFKTHQYYSTPDEIGAAAAALVGSKGELLEPSGGTGGMLKHVTGPVTVVEVSSIHCEVLKAKGYRPIMADFMRWDNGKKYDRIIMNPPFSQGRWKAHTERAAGMLASDGVLVAVVPASAAGNYKIDGFNVEYGQRFNGLFKGASVDVVLIRITR